MSTVSRIERTADRLAGYSTHMLNGSSLMALNAIIYTERKGIAGDIFVSFARDFGTNLAIITVALLFLAALWGFMLVVYFAIAGILIIGRGIKALLSRIERRGA